VRTRQRETERERDRERVCVCICMYDIHVYVYEYMRAMILYDICMYDSMERVIYTCKIILYV